VESWSTWMVMCLTCSFLSILNQEQRMETRKTSCKKFSAPRLVNLQRLSRTKIAAREVTPMHLLACAMTAIHPARLAPHPTSVTRVLMISTSMDHLAACASSALTITTCRITSARVAQQPLTTWNPLRAVTTARGIAINARMAILVTSVTRASSYKKDYSNMTLVRKMIRLR